MQATTSWWSVRDDETIGRMFTGGGSRYRNAKSDGLQPSLKQGG